MEKAGASKVKVESRTFTVGESGSLELQLLSSAFHIELTPADAGTKDVVVIQKVSKHSFYSPPHSACQGAGAVGHGLQSVLQVQVRGDQRRGPTQQTGPGRAQANNGEVHLHLQGDLAVRVLHQAHTTH